MYFCPNVELLKYFPLKDILFKLKGYFKIHPNLKIGFL